MILIPAGSGEFDPSDPSRRSGPLLHTPTPALRLITELSAAHACQPDKVLEVSPEYRQYVTEGLGSLVLADLLDQSLGGPRNPSAPQFAITDRVLDTCAMAETRFLAEIQNQSTEQSLRIVVDDDEQPLLIQKNVNNKAYSVRSGLTLTDINIGRLTWPAGTLVSAASYNQLDYKDPITITPHDQIGALGPLRLSAFAFDPDERLPFNEKNFGNPAPEKSNIGDVTLQEVRDRVTELLNAA